MLKLTETTAIPFFTHPTTMSAPSIPPLGEIPIPTQPDVCA